MSPTLRFYGTRAALRNWKATVSKRKPCYLGGIHKHPKRDGFYFDARLSDDDRAALDRAWKQVNTEVRWAPLMLVGGRR